MKTALPDPFVEKIRNVTRYYIEENRKYGIRFIRPKTARFLPASTIGPTYERLLEFLENPSSTRPLSFFYDCFLAFKTTKYSEGLTDVIEIIA